MKALRWYRSLSYKLGLASKRNECEWGNEVDKEEMDISIDA